MLTELNSYDQPPWLDERMSLLDYWETQRGIKRRKTSGEVSDTLSPSTSTTTLKTKPETPGEDSASEKRPPSPSPSLWTGREEKTEGSKIENHGFEDHLKSSQTDLETSLPTIESDESAIRAYEASQTNDESPQSALHMRLRNGVWEKGKSSIYVDAFNLALETVLEEESHLFDEAELHVFNEWKELAYESQYLYGLSLSLGGQ